MASVLIHPDSEISATTLEQLIFTAATLLKEYASKPNGISDRRGVVNLRVDADRGLITVTVTAPVVTHLSHASGLLFVPQPFVNNPSE